MLCTNGCFLAMRGLKDENNLLKARNEQLSQDFMAERTTSSSLAARLAQLEEQHALATSRVTTLDAENRRLQDRVLALQSTLGDSQRASADSVTEQLSERLELENQMRLQIERLEAQLEGALAERDVATRTYEAFKQRYDDLVGENELARQLAADLQSETEAERAALEKTDAELAEARGQVAAINAELATLRAQVEARAQAEATRASAADTARRALADALAPQIAAGTAAVPADGEPRALLLSDALYQSGTVLLSAEGEKMLAAIETALASAPFSAIRVEGHTDTVPVGRMPFVDNWDLAAARASTVTRWLAARPGLEGKRLVVESLAFNEPIAPNDTAAGRKQNRRVEVVIVP
jgi:chemotaxis protein MotB